VLQAYNFLNDQNRANLTIRRNIFDGTNEQGGSAAIGGGGNITIEYNWFLGGTQHVFDYGTSGVTKSVTYRYNLIDNMNIPATYHMNYMQWGVTNSTITVIIDFNTTFQNTLGGAEGFQWASFSPGMVLPSPSFRNNTMISRAVGGVQTMSTMVHGNGSDSAITGTGLNKDNHFDLSGAFFPYYAGTMTPARGWSSSGNIDMNTGAVITPP
jgi:hypothetical protein